MKIEKLKEVINQYQNYGIKHGVEFLLPPEEAINFIRDLSQLNIAVWACDLWRYADKEKGWIVALLGDGLVIDNPSQAQNEALANARIMIDYLKNHLPDDAELISFVFKGKLVDDLLAC